MGLISGEHLERYFIIKISVHSKSVTKMGAYHAHRLLCFMGEIPESEYKKKASSSK